MDGGTITDYVAPTYDGMLFRGAATSDFGGFRQVWPRGRQNIQITYDHGFPSDELPRSIRMVALMIAARLVVQGVAQSETVGDVTMNYGQAASDMTKGEQAIMYGYLAKRSF